MTTDEEIDTSNHYFVGVRGNMVTSLILRQEFTQEQAFNLAAYLVTMAGMEAPDGGTEHFLKVLAAVQNA